MPVPGDTACTDVSHRVLHTTGANGQGGVRGNKLKVSLGDLANTINLINLGSKPIDLKASDLRHPRETSTRNWCFRLQKMLTFQSVHHGFWCIVVSFLILHSRIFSGCQVFQFPMKRKIFNLRVWIVNWWDLHGIFSSSIKVVIAYVTLLYLIA